jgi:hypothetical protein
MSDKELLKKQKEWKEFEKSLIPIIDNCESCREFAICGFHERWYYRVKKAFNKLWERYNE